MGRRVLEGLNMTILRPEARRVTDVWLPTWVKEDFRRRLGLLENFEFFERIGIVKVHEIDQGEPLHVDGVRIRAYRMAEPGLTAFLLEQGRRRVVLALDDTKGWLPGDDLLEPDLLVVEAGWFERDAKGRLLVPKNHWLRGSEASFEDTLRLVERINPSRTVLTHIEELNGRSYDDYVKLERKHKGLNLRFAYDGLRLLV